LIINGGLVPPEDPSPRVARVYYADSLYSPFSWAKDSLLGVLHGQSWDGIDFYTEKKVVIERWPVKWSRRF
jgi:hypothetical protein